MADHRDAESLKAEWDAIDKAVTEAGIGWLDSRLTLADRVRHLVGRAERKRLPAPTGPCQ